MAAKSKRLRRKKLKKNREECHEQVNEQKRKEVNCTKEKTDCTINERNIKEWR